MTAGIYSGGILATARMKRCCSVSAWPMAEERTAVIASSSAVAENISPCRKPLRTITAGGGEFGIVRVTLKRTGGMGYWPQVRALLNRFCGYDLGDKECLVLMIGGVGYYIADITLRMLTPRELYNAMGFPPDYQIERDYLGNAYPKSKQVARCGNAVCPPLAEAMVRANLPEWCGEKITTMERLGEVQTA